MASFEYRFHGTTDEIDDSFLVCKAILASGVVNDEVMLLDILFMAKTIVSMFVECSPCLQPIPKLVPRWMNL
jgi:hypothetical protein